MRSYRLTKQAEEDLKSILTYTKHVWGEVQAEKYSQKISAICSKLANLSHIGILSDYILEDTRKIVVDKHIIFYKVEAETILILRILHSSMDVENVGF